MDATNQDVSWIELPTRRRRVKRTHFKSRLGCMTCRQRRVKCDETQPICVKCSTRGINCSYGIHEPTTQAAARFQNVHIAHGDTSSSSPQGTDATLSSASAEEKSAKGLARRPRGSVSIDESELALQFFEFVVPSFCSSSIRPERHWIWHVFVPSLGYASDTVRRGILTLGAISLHLQYQAPVMKHSRRERVDTSTRYLDAAVAHGNIFVEQSRSKLSELQATEAKVNLVLTRLLVILAFAFFRHYRHEGINVRDPQAWNWLHLVRGVQPVHVSVLQSGQDIPLALKRDCTHELFSFAENQNESPLDIGASTQRLLTFISETREKRFKMLRSALNDSTFDFDDQNLSSSRRNGARAAIKSLIRVTDHICAWNEMQSLFRALCTWPGDIAPEFVQLLIKGNVSALAIYTHWLMLVALAEDLWWVGDMGKYGLRMILDLIPETDSGLSRVVAAPRAFLDLLSTSLE